LVTSRDRLATYDIWIALINPLIRTMSCRHYLLVIELLGIGNFVYVRKPCSVSGALLEHKK